MYVTVAVHEPVRTILTLNPTDCKISMVTVQLQLSIIAGDGLNIRNNTSTDKGRVVLIRIQTVVEVIFDDQDPTFPKMLQNHVATGTNERMSHP